MTSGWGEPSERRLCSQSRGQGGGAVRVRGGAHSLGFQGAFPMRRGAANGRPPRFSPPAGRGDLRSGTGGPGRSTQTSYSASSSSSSLALLCVRRARGEGQRGFSPSPCNTAAGAHPSLSAVSEPHRVPGLGRHPLNAPERREGRGRKRAGLEAHRGRLHPGPAACEQCGPSRPLPASVSAEL